MGLRFGKLVLKKREQLGLQQDEIADFGQSYMSDIENGRKRPATRKTIAKLAEALSIPKDQVTWLWIYSLLDADPNVYFGHNPGHPLTDEDFLSARRHVLKEETAEYAPDENDYHISEGDTLAEIQAKLGKPDESLYFKNQRKWFYHRLGAQVLFEDERVVDVVFK